MSPILSLFFLSPLSPALSFRLQKLFFILPLFAVSAALGQPLNATSSTPSSGASPPANSTTTAPILTSNLSNSNKTDLLHTGESKPEAYLVHLKPKKRSRNKSATNAKNKYLLLLRLPEDQTDHTAAGSSVDQQQRSVDDFSLNDDQNTQQQQQSGGGGFSDAIQVQDNGDDSDQQQNDQQSNNLSGNQQEEDQGFDDISQFARSKPDTGSFGQRTSAPSNDYNQPQQQQQPQQVNEPVEQNNNNDQFDDSFSPNNQQQNDQPTYFSPIKSTKQINRAPASYVGPSSSKGGNTQINYKTEIQHDMPVQQQQQPQSDDFSAPGNQQQNDDFSAPVNQQNNDYEGKRSRYREFFFFSLPLVLLSDRTSCF